MGTANLFYVAYDWGRAGRFFHKYTAEGNEVKAGMALDHYSDCFLHLVDAGCFHDEECTDLREQYKPYVAAALAGRPFSEVNQLVEAV